MSHNPSSSSGTSLPPNTPPTGGASPQKKRPAWLPAMIVLAIILVAGASYFLYFGITNTMNYATLNAYCDGWKSGDAQKIYDQFEHSTFPMTLEQIQKAVQSSEESGGIKECLVNNFEQKDTLARADVMKIFDDGSTENRVQCERVTLISVDRTWKVASVELVGCPGKS